MARVVIQYVCLIEWCQVSVAFILMCLGNEKEQPKSRSKTTIWPEQDCTRRLIMMSKFYNGKIAQGECHTTIISKRSIMKSKLWHGKIAHESVPHNHHQPHQPTCSICNTNQPIGHFSVHFQIFRKNFGTPCQASSRVLTLHLCAAVLWMFNLLHMGQCQWLTLLLHGFAAHGYPMGAQFVAHGSLHDVMGDCMIGHDNGPSVLANQISQFEVRFWS